MLNLFAMDKNLERFIIPISAVIVACIALFVLRQVFFARWRAWLKQHPSMIGARALIITRSPSIYFCIALSIYAGINIAELPPKPLLYLNQTIQVLLILTVVVTIANIAAEVARNALPISGLGLGVIRSVIIGIGGLIILSVLGISVAPLLTALGVGGLAVALALKDTLENLFAGIYLITDRTIHVGDFVRLESGQEGSILDIGWRTTRISVNNNVLIIPNIKLSQSSVMNYSLPDRRVAVTMPVSVAIDADTEKAEEIMVQAVKKGSEDIVGVLSQPEPFVRFVNTTGEGAHNLTLHFHVASFPDQGFATYELRRRILRQFKAEGISLPQKSTYLLPAPV